MSSSGKGKRRSLERARSAAPRSPRDLGGALSDVADDMRCELCELDCADVPRLRSKRTGAVRHQGAPRGGDPRGAPRGSTSAARGAKEPRDPAGDDAEDTADAREPVRVEIRAPEGVPGGGGERRERKGPARDAASRNRDEPRVRPRRARRAASRDRRTPKPKPRTTRSSTLLPRPSPSPRPVAAPLAAVATDAHPADPRVGVSGVRRRARRRRRVALARVFRLGPVALASLVASLAAVAAAVGSARPSTSRRWRGGAAAALVLGAWARSARATRRDARGRRRTPSRARATSRRELAGGDRRRARGKRRRGADVRGERTRRRARAAGGGDSTRVPLWGRFRSRQTRFRLRILGRRFRYRRARERSPRGGRGCGSEGGRIGRRRRRDDGRRPLRPYSSRPLRERAGTYDLSGVGRPFRRRRGPPGTASFCRRSGRCFERSSRSSSLPSGAAKVVVGVDSRDRMLLVEPAEFAGSRLTSARPPTSSPCSAELGGQRGRGRGAARPRELGRARSGRGDAPGGP